jgi:hypothetical protein
MSGILDNLPGGTKPKRGPTCAALHIGDVRYANSAAKFWPALIEEALHHRPDCVALELAATCSGALSADRLHPERELQKSIEELANADLHEIIRNTISELELTGPPGPVELRIVGPAGEETSLCLPLDVVDAELMPYLLGWLLEWAGIAEGEWNAERIAGSFAARDARRRLGYEFAFSVINRHLAEGLYRRALRLHAKVKRHAR